MGKTIIKICTGCCKKQKPKKPKYKARMRFHVGPQSFVEGENTVARLTNEEVVSASVTYLTAKGNPAPVEGDVVWASSDEAVATVTVDPADSKNATVTAVAPGVCQISATADADMDVGEVREVVATGAIEVVAAEAQQAEIVFGTPQ